MYAFYPFRDIWIEQGFSTQDHWMADLYLGRPPLEIFCIVVPGLPSFKMIIVVAVAAIAGEIAHIGDVELQAIDEYSVRHRL